MLHVSGYFHWYVSYFAALFELDTEYMIGRANVGKSSLINRVMGRKDLVKTSAKAVSKLLLEVIFREMRARSSRVIHKPSISFKSVPMLENLLLLMHRGTVLGDDQSGARCLSITYQQERGTSNR